MTYQPNLILQITTSQLGSGVFALIIFHDIRQHVRKGKSVHPNISCQATQVTSCLTLAVNTAIPQLLHPGVTM